MAIQYFALLQRHYCSVLKPNELSTDVILMQRPLQNVCILIVQPMNMLYFSHQECCLCGTVELLPIKAISNQQVNAALEGSTLAFVTDLMTPYFSTYCILRR